MRKYGGAGRGFRKLFSVEPGHRVIKDPAILVEPYVLQTRMLRLNANPDAGLIHERGNCEVFEGAAVAPQIRCQQSALRHSSNQGEICERFDSWPVRGGFWR
jgi:hypothetical protein